MQGIEQDGTQGMHDAQGLVQILQTVRVREIAGPLGTVRLSVRAIGAAEGFVFCRHRMNTPFALSIEDWLSLPLADEAEYDV